MHAHPQQIPGPGKHLLGRLAGEGEQKNGGGRNPLFHQIGQTVDYRPGLAAPGPGNDQQRTFRGRNGSILGGIEFVFVIDEHENSVMR